MAVSWKDVSVRFGLLYLSQTFIPGRLLSMCDRSIEHHRRKYGKPTEKREGYEISWNDRIPNDNNATIRSRKIHKDEERCDEWGIDHGGVRSRGSYILRSRGRNHRRFMTLRKEWNVRAKREVDAKSDRERRADGLLPSEIPKKSPEALGCRRWSPAVHLRDPNDKPQTIDYFLSGCPEYMIWVLICSHVTE